MMTAPASHRFALLEGYHGIPGVCPMLGLPENTGREIVQSTHRTARAAIRAGNSELFSQHVPHGFQPRIRRVGQRSYYNGREGFYVVRPIRRGKRKS